MADNSSQFILVIRVFFGEVRLILLLLFIVIESVGIEIEIHGELVLVGKLLVDEGFKVHVNSLKVNDEVMRNLADPCLFGDVNFFLTEIAFVVADQFSKNVTIERL